ncbi:uncharacterized protein LOC130974539 [Arachis stenosperma]|uniref:uncharacterized protein LOC130974539 n=1 Tax=Arachis stenosperma TaxID=217475 RepID=UPI0025ABB506|nr:uncharacterized protein LOC130974539 [Arachis stenosperma]
MCFETLDRTLRDLLSVTDQHKTHQPFGGKVMVLGGDFRQILLVIAKESRHDILSSAINSFHLWLFCKVLKLHTNMRLLMSSLGQRDDYKYFQSRAILALMLESVEKVNDFVSTIFPEMENKYLSYDTTCQADENEDPGVVVILLQNIDETSSLYNGTRLIVNELDNNVIGASVVTGRNIGDKVYISRMNLIPSDL